MRPSRRLSRAFTCVLLAAAAALASAPGASAGSSAAMAQTVSGGGTTDPAFDWEKPPARPSSDRYALTTFKSTRPLAQTTAWLTSALERYGRKKGDFEISDVHFAGCTMRWTFRDEPTGGVTRVSAYAIDLRDVDLAAPIQVSTEAVKFYTKHDFSVVEKYFEKGRQKAPPATTKESSVQLRMRDDDLMPGRVSWALVHAARLCGAPVPPPR